MILPLQTDIHLKKSLENIEYVFQAILNHYQVSEGQYSCSSSHNQVYHLKGQYCNIVFGLDVDSKINSNISTPFIYFDFFHRYEFPYCFTEEAIQYIKSKPCVIFNEGSSFFISLNKLSPDVIETINFILNQNILKPRLNYINLFSPDKENKLIIHNLDKNKI